MTVKVVQETLFGPDNILENRSVIKVNKSPALRVNLPAGLRATGCLQVIDDPNSAEVIIPGVEDPYGKDIYHRDVHVQSSRGNKVAWMHVARDTEVTLSVTPGFTITPVRRRK